MRAIRGAITVDENDAGEIAAAAQELLRVITERNFLKPEDMISIIFTVTEDLTKAFPAAAVRKMGITDVPLLDLQEAAVEGALEKCIRTLVFVHGSGKDVHHVYLKGAARLRPDLTE